MSVSVNARENRNDFSLDLNVASESLCVTVLGRESQHCLCWADIT